MNFQELLTRLSASCFAADRPDHDWKTLRLFSKTGLNLVLLARLAAAVILCVIGALVHGTVLRYVLLSLSALTAGYDYLAAAIACILARQPFRSAVIVVVCVIGCIAVGQPVDAAVFLLVYRVMSLLIAVVTAHAEKTLEAAVGGEIHSPAEFTAPKWVNYLAPAGLCIAVLVAVLESVLKIATVTQAIHSGLIVLFLATPCALLISVPLVWYSAVNGAYHCNVLFRSCRSMRALNAVRAVAVDEGEGDSQLPKVVSVKSSQLAPEALLQLAANAESCSNSRTARAICAAYNGPILTQYISNAVDIPESGVEVYIESTRVCVGTRELMILKGVDIPDADLTDGYAVYVSVGEQYAGKILLQEVVQTDTKPALNELRALGVHTITLFSNANNDSVSENAKALKADHLYCKCSGEEKERILSQQIENLSDGELLLYYDRRCTAHPEHSAADLDVCVIPEESDERFDADVLLTSPDPYLLPEAIETAGWVEGICREHLAIGIVVKVLLLMMAELGYCTLWFAAVLDGAAALGTLLMAIRAFGFDKPHHRVRDYLPKVRSK